MIEIDGSFGKASGQIIRTACALSVITKKNCYIFNIRKSHSKPGLTTQDLSSIQALAKFCNGRLEGDCLGSEEIKFYPENIDESTSIDIKIKSSESITLLLQALIPPCLSGSNPTTINIDGGATDTFFSPTIDYFEHCFLKILRKLKVRVDLSILKRGYYPEGGAKVKAIVYPSEIEGINLLKRGDLRKILVFSRSSKLLKDKKVAERQAAGIREVLGNLNLPIEKKIEYYQTDCLGNQVCLIGEFEDAFIAVDILGKLGERAEDIGKKAALELLKEQKSQARFDKYMADQILIYMALANKKSSISVSEVTDHCKTNVWIIKKFLQGNFEIKENSIEWTPLS